MLDIELRRGEGSTLERQLHDQLRRHILSGRLAIGTVLPSSRELAGQIRLSRNIVNSVIQQLALEGYLDCARGRRPRVAAATNMSTGVGRPCPPHPPRQLSRWARTLDRSKWPVAGHEGAPRPLLPGMADDRAFPHGLWARLLRRAAIRAASRHPFEPNRPRLRQALLRHLAEHRGVRAVASQVIIMPTAQAAISLVARVLLDPGDLAWIESPSYPGARAAIENAGARIRGVGLDECGLTIDRTAERPRLIFVTPSHQYPTGRLMPIGRRRELLEYAEASAATVVEDDYDSEFQYDARSVAAMQGLDDAGSVVYVGTFSKTMFSGIRVGYCVVPASLAGIVEAAQRHGGHIIPASFQDALADFIEEGHLAAHIRRMTRIYRERRNRLVEALRAAAGTDLVIEPPAGGLQLQATFSLPRDDGPLVSRLADAGVTVRSLSSHCVGEATQWGLFMGFAAWNEREIETAAETVGTVLRSS